MESPYHYRNKVQAAFGRTREGKIISGVYQSKSHRIVNVDSCMTEDEIADKIIVDIRNMLPKLKIQVYDEDRGTGFLRHVLVKRGFTSGEIMVVVVSSSHIFPQKNAFRKELLRLHPEITTIVLSINSKDTNLVLGDREEVLFGDGFIRDKLCGLTFRISPRSFYQINPVQTEKLYSKAIELAELNKSSVVIDAYCGIGTIGLVAAKSAGKVVGVELNPDAVRDAKINCKENNLTNARFYAGDAGDFMDEIAGDDYAFRKAFGIEKEKCKGDILYNESSRSEPCKAKLLYKENIQKECKADELYSKADTLYGEVDGNNICASDGKIIESAGNEIIKTVDENNSANNRIIKTIDGNIINSVNNRTVETIDGNKINSVNNRTVETIDENINQNLTGIDVVFMDPPRSGSTKKFLLALMKLAPKKIVYISCNPETQARDLKILSAKYKVIKICPVDMFPHTNHVETVILLCKK